MNPVEARRLVVDALHQIAPEVDAATLADDDPLHEVAGLDSLDFLQLAAAVAEQTGAEVPERDYPALASLRSCIAYVAARA